MLFMAVDIQLYRAGDLDLRHRHFAFFLRLVPARIDTAVSTRGAFASVF